MILLLLILILLVLVLLLLIVSHVMVMLLMRIHHHLLLHHRHSSCWILHSCHPLLLLLHVWDPLLLMRMLRLVLWRWVLIRTVALLHLDLNMISQSPPSPPPPSSSTTTTLKASNLCFCLLLERESACERRGEERRGRLKEEERGLRSLDLKGGAPWIYLLWSATVRACVVSVLGFLSVFWETLMLQVSPPII